MKINERRQDRIGQDMRICVPTMGNNGLGEDVSPHFGRAPRAVRMFEDFGFEVYVGAQKTAEDTLRM